MNALFRSAPLFAALLCATTAAHAGEAFAPPGSKATLTVDYVYESVGKRSSEGMYEPHEWRARRSVNLVADMVAFPAASTPQLQALDASQAAQLKSMGDKGQAAAAHMAPMVENAQAAMDKCGDDDACFAREAQKMTTAMMGTPQGATAMRAGKEVQALAQPGAPRYQAWRATAQKGRYAIDETAHLSITDPICTSRPRHRCTRDEVRKGAGEVPLSPEGKKNARADAGYSAVEVDNVKNTLTVTLPAPIVPLPYTETITTDEPAETHDTPVPKGPQQKLQRFRVNAAGGVTQDQPFTLPLKGGWRSQSGEQVVMLKGEFGDAGKLTVRWHFKAL